MVSAVLRSAVVEVVLSRLDYSSGAGLHFADLPL